MKKEKRIAIITAGTIFLMSGCGSSKGENNLQNENTDNNLLIKETILDNEIDEDNLNTPIQASIFETTNNTEGYTDCDDEIYVSVDSNFRTEATVSDNIIEVIDKCQKVHRISTNEDWDFLEYNGKTGFVKSDCTEVLPESYIEVDIDAQTIYLYKDEDLLLSSNIVSGKNSSPTRIGYFKINSKSKNAVLRGPGYASPVKYWMPFDKGIGLHDASWRSTFGGTIYKKDGSHGCVNLQLETVRTIYDNYSVGDKVLVHK